MADETTETTTEDAESAEAGATTDAGTGDATAPERATATGPYEEGAGQVESHPRPSAYVGIAVILAIVTAVEVGLYYVEDWSTTTITISLLVLMVVKFFLVASWFMHLRFETPLFRRLFYGGVILAMAVYAVVLAASHVFPILV